MKMNRFNPYLFLMAFMFSFVFAACGSDDDDGNGEEPVDNEKPAINITAPAEGDPFSIAVGTFAVTGELTDNVALDTCSFSLTTDLKSASSLKSIDDPQVWQPNPKGFSLEGKSKIFTAEEVFGPIPDDAMTGAYTLNIEVIDAAGNSAAESITFTLEEE